MAFNFMQNILPGESSGMPDQMPQDDSMMQLELQRRLKFADALRQQEMPQGQMVSGHYVAPSWTQALAGLANKYVAGKQEQNAMKQYGDYQAAKAKKYANLMTDLEKGKETVTTDTTPFQIQVPNGQTPPTENLGGMQPYNNGMKSIDVPNTTKTSTFSPYSQQEYMAKVLQAMPEFAPKFLEADIARKGQQEQLKAQHEYDMLIHKRDRGEKLTDTENANLFELKKLGITEEAKARENALTRGVTMRGQDMTNANQPLVAILDANGQPTYVPRNQAMGKAPYNPNQAKLTEAQSNANLFGTRAAEAHKILNDLNGKFSPAAIQAQESMVGNLPGVGYVINKSMSPSTQKAAQAERDFVNAVLRKESGAAIGAKEFDEARKQYFPQPGDSAETIAQKQANRETAIKGIQLGSGISNQPQVRTVDW